MTYGRAVGTAALVAVGGYALAWGGTMAAAAVYPDPKKVPVTGIAVALSVVGVLLSAFIIKARG